MSSGCKKTTLVLFSWSLVHILSMGVGVRVLVPIQETIVAIRPVFWHESGRVIPRKEDDESGKRVCTSTGADCLAILDSPGTILQRSGAI